MHRSGALTAGIAGRSALLRDYPGTCERNRVRQFIGSETALQDSLRTCMRAPPRPSTPNRLWLRLAGCGRRQGGQVAARLLQPLGQRPFQPAARALGVALAGEAARQIAARASSGRRHDHAPPRHGTSAALSTRSVGTSWPPPCIAPTANIAPTWPRPAAFSNNARAPGGPSRRRGRSASFPPAWTSASGMPTSRGPGDPAASLLRIGVDAAAFDQHAAIPVLRVHHTIGGTAQPFARPCGRRARRRRLRPGRRRS